MEFLKWLIGLVWGGGGTIGKVADAISKTHIAMANTEVEKEKAAYQNQLDNLNATLADLNNARGQMKDEPWWMATLAVMFGLPFAVHVMLIGIGTNFAAPLQWPWLMWTTHIPPFPKPYDTTELGIIQFFYGYAIARTGLSTVSKVLARK